MLRARIAMTFLVTVALAVWSEDLSGQPTTLPRLVSPTPLAVLVLNGIDDQNIIDELKLSPDQVKTLVARRAELWDEAYTTAPTKLADRAAERNKGSIAFLQKTFTEAQYKRAVQLGAQSVLGRGGLGGPLGFAQGMADGPPTFLLTRVTSTTLNRYPELIEAFKFTEDQKGLLATPLTKGGPGTKGGLGTKGGGGVAARSFAMAPDQIAAVTDFMGPVFTKRWQQKADPRFSMGAAEPQELSLLASEDVRTALKVNAEQMKVMNVFQEKWTQLNNDRRTDLSPKEADENARVLAAESEKALTAQLKPEQVMRLKQIAFQTSKGLHIEQCYQESDVAKALGLVEKQVKELDEIWEAYRKSTVNVLEAAESFAIADKQVKELTAKRQAKAEAVLNTDQTSKLREMVGEMFIGSTLPDSFRGQFPRITPTLRLFVTANPTFGEALKLTPEQAKTIGAAREAYQKVMQSSGPFGPGSGLPGSPAEVFATQNRAIENLQKTVNSVLTDEQAKRLPQLVIQSDAAASLVNTLTAAEMAQTLKLTVDQTTKLIAVGEDAVKLQELRSREIQIDPDQKLARRLRDAADDRMLALLTDVQKAQWKELIGEPWLGLRKTIPTRFGRPGGGGGPLGGAGGGGFGGGFGFDP